MFAKKIGSDVINNALKGLKKVVTDLNQGINICKLQVKENEAALEAKKAAYEKFETEVTTENDSLVKSAEAAEKAKENIKALLGITED